MHPEFFEVLPEIAQARRIRSPDTFDRKLVFIFISGFTDVTTLLLNKSPFFPWRQGLESSCSEQVLRDCQQRQHQDERSWFDV